MTGLKAGERREPEDAGEQAQRTAEPAAPDVAVSARTPMTAAGVLTLQRHLGNQAVGAILARNGDGGTATADAGAPPGGVQDIWTLITQSMYDAVVDQLKVKPAAERTATLHGMSREQLERVRDTAAGKGPDYVEVRDAAETARIRQLGLDWEAAVAAERWEEAVRLVQSYNDLDLPVKLEALSYSQIQSLCNQADRMLPFYLRVRLAAEPIRVRKHRAAYDAAVGANNWNLAALLANAFNDIDLDAALQVLKTAGTIGSLDNGALAMQMFIGPRVHRHILFIQNGPAAAGAQSDYTVTSAGTAAGTGIAGGGVVNARMDVGYQMGTETSSEGYELEYKGADAANTHWLQFISRTVWGVSATAPQPDYVSANVVSTGSRGAGYALTTDPARPSWNTDSADATQPFYTAGGVGQRDPTTSTMLDEPSPRTDFVARAFARGADTVTSQARFVAYLTRGMGVLYRAEVLVKWEFKRADHYDAATSAVTSVPARKQSLVGGSVVSALDPAHRARLAVDFPTHDYFP